MGDLNEKHTTPSDLPPFRFCWHFPGLGTYRPGGGATYNPFRHEELPPLPEESFRGALQWLPPLEDLEGLSGMDYYYSDTDLQQLLTTAEHLQVSLPEDFLLGMRSPQLLKRIPSCTDCYFETPKAIIPSPPGEGYLIRFLIDRQGVIGWYLYLTPQGKQAILVGYPWFDDPDDDSLHAIALPDICASSFEEFLYRFWVENMLWFKIVHFQGKIPLKEEEKRYLQYYSQEI
jgi:hypothetical protein